MQFKYKDFIPKSVVCLQEGYNWNYFLSDLFAGISVGVIALPLALAFGIASGVSPEKGLITAIIAGFLISLFSGSRVQIGGPTGAFVVIIYEIIQKYGYDGLALATLVAAVMMILMGLARFGVLLRFIPYPVTVGFTTGIAVVIFSSQIKDFLGLQIEKVPSKFLEKCLIFCETAHTWNPWAFAIAASTLALIFILRHYYPKLPGAIFAVALATIATSAFQLPLETIEAKFGGIPSAIPTPALPSFSYDLLKTIFPDAITIALLGAIESLLSAVVADGMTGHKHRSNCELVGQGLANIGSVLFGGIPATGAIARTSANIRMGAKTPFAGMIHAITLLLLMLFLAPLAGKIPLAALSGVLLFVAWNMSELPHFIEILKGQRGDALVLVMTFLLTVLIDLTVAVQIGVILSAFIFLKRMTDKTTVEICKLLVKENEHEDPEFNNDKMLLRQDIPSDVVVFEIRGPFFYSVADLLDEALSRLDTVPRFFILRLNKTPLVDATGIHALKQFNKKCKQKGVVFLLSEINPNLHQLFKQSKVEELVGKEFIFSDIDTALDFAREH
ncbi:SulP family inorganic anion transporter [Candidatus Protochlamydia phocaeensis]|uniref:SulP family inorganic anion transporter n=1 Tax=Candidatus Protochlamydia phocaeensis TaxID=1414722 RepID=UPI0008391073|nr:sulfate permease [Candidatus Protochlamydia phocaeensis]